MAEKDQSQIFNNTLKLAEAAFVDMPLSALKRIAGIGDDRETYEAGWKAYDAFVGLSNEATDRLFMNETFGSITGQVIDMTAALQRLNNALAGAFFATLWRTVGLPTADEVEAVRHEVRALREEVRGAEIEAPGERVDTRREREARRQREARIVVREPLWEQWTFAENKELKRNVGN
jgi:hypothetical protein